MSVYLVYPTDDEAYGYCNVFAAFGTRLAAETCIAAYVGRFEMAIEEIEIDADIDDEPGRGV